MQKAELQDERGGLPSVSSFPRYDACRGAFLASKGQPDSSGKDAQAGERVHAAVARKLTAGNGYNFDELGYADAENARDLVRQIGEIIEREFGTVAPHRFVEQRLWYLSEDLDPLFSGKPDLVLVANDGSKAVILDYKNGWGHQDSAEIHLQLRGQAALVVDHFPVETALAGILRPGRKPDFALFAGDALKQACEFSEILVAEITDTEHPAPLTAGDHCKYCPARGICPAALSLIMDTNEAAIAPKTLEIIPGSQLNTWLLRAIAAEPIIDALKDEAKRRLTLGQGTEGLEFELKEGGNTPKIDNTGAAFFKVQEYVNAVEFLGATTVKIGDLRALLAKKRDLTKEQAIATLDALLGDSIEYKPKAPSLKRIKAAKAKVV